MVSRENEGGKMEIPEWLGGVIVFKQVGFLALKIYGAFSELRIAIL